MGWVELTATSHLFAPSNCVKMTVIWRRLHDKDTEI